MTTSHDLPSLDCAYKLQEYAGVARRKRSPGKATWPGAKQVWRTFDAAGRPCADRVTLAHEHGPEQSRALLVPVMRHGRRIAEPHPLAALRDTVAEQLARLPESLTRLSGGPHYPVSIAPSLLSLADDIDRQVAT
jgi:nicotinate phosphoribosyltransferase